MNWSIVETDRFNKWKAYRYLLGGNPWGLGSEQC